eukprot:310090-Pleurochrysis_carterae.AAC.4
MELYKPTQESKTANMHNMPGSGEKPKCDVTTVLPRKLSSRLSVQDQPIVLSQLTFVTSFDIART